MIFKSCWRCFFFTSFAVSALVGVRLSADEATAAAPGKIETGQRVFSAGHSFHVFVPGILSEMAKAAGIEGHTQVGVQSLGGSRVVQHWNLPEEKNKAKDALNAGQVDVLTLSPIYLPDEGIENFLRLALEKNPQARVAIQEFWLPFDVYAADYQKQRPAAVDRNARTAEEMRKEHEPYFQSIDAHVAALNKQFDRPVLFVVPVGHAVIALREKIIAGEAPGLTAQNDLFTDAIGHPTAPLKALVAYCHYAVIYRRSPVGLPLPSVLEKSGNAAGNAELNVLLQEIAWQAVTAHPLSGIQKM